MEKIQSKPVWLLDIDGVVNAVTGGNPPLYIWKNGWKQDRYISNTTKADGIPLIWNERVVDFITSVHTDGLAEIVWHSSWRSEATEFGKIVGLPRFAISDAPEWGLYRGAFIRDQILARKPGWWKYPAAERVLDSGRPLVWTDDEIKTSVGAAHRTAMSGMGSVQLVCPDQQTGLLTRHMKWIKEFLDVSQPQT